MFIFVALICMILIAVLSYIHGVVAHDDDGATAGLDLAAADFIDGEDKVITRELGGKAYAPVLRNVHFGVFGQMAAAGKGTCRWQLQPNPWSESRTIGGWVDWVGGSKQADAGTAPYADGKRQLNVSKYNYQLTNNLDWINAGNSKTYVPVANNDFVLLLQMSYGPLSPFRGGPILHIVKTIAAVAGADVWDEGFNEVFTDDSPGTDPDRRYRLAAMACLGGATRTTDYTQAFRLTSKGHPCQAICLGGGINEDMPLTVFDVDSIEFNGNAVMKGETINSATNDGAEAHLYLEDIGPAIYDDAAKAPAPVGPTLAGGEFGGGGGGGPVGGGMMDFIQNAVRKLG